jgi:hypothetical protein
MLQVEKMGGCCLTDQLHDTATVLLSDDSVDENKLMILTKITIIILIIIIIIIIIIKNKLFLMNRTQL